MTLYRISSSTFDRKGPIVLILAFPGIFTDGMPFQIAERNRGCYRKLRAELESLTESGICLNKKLLISGASVMQRLTVEMLCNQLDNTWKYFTATFKMQAKQSFSFPPKSTFTLYFI